MYLLRYQYLCLIVMSPTEKVKIKALCTGVVWGGDPFGRPRSLNGGEPGKKAARLNQAVVIEYGLQ